MSLSKVMLKAKGLLFVQDSNIIPTRHNMWMLLSQAEISRGRECIFYQSPDVLIPGPGVAIPNETVEKT